MIRPMNKYAFLVFHQEYEEFLSYLQSLGVVHITERTKPQEAEALKAIADERTAIKPLFSSLRTYLPEAYEAPEHIVYRGEEAKEQAIDALAKYGSLAEESQELRKQIASQEVWGEFDTDRLEALRLSGYHLVAYACSALVYGEEYEREHACIPIAKRAMTQYFVRLEREGQSPCPEAEKQVLPSERLSLLRQRLELSEQALEDYRLELSKQAPELYEALRGYDAQLEDRFSYGSAKLQGERYAEDKLVFLEGWIPQDEGAKLEEQLSISGYYYQQCDIKAEDKVPISLKNNAFARGFEHITRMFSLPNYSEIDQTLLFAPFFMLFFGLCMGDAGYGLLIFAGATYFRCKAKPSEDRSAYSLMQYLGAAAFVLGMLTGSLFGVTLPYASSKDYFLNQDNLMLLSVVLGILQIFFAKGVAVYKTKKQKGIKYALAPLSWIVFLLVLGVLLALPHLGIVLPMALHYVLYAVVGITALVILLYNSPSEGILLNVGSALWTAYNTASGLLGDTLSYIRLFAIGLTGAILGSVFNTLAIDSTEGLSPFLRFPLMLVILLAGHGINFGIAIIGALVHPIRLTFVEYYKNSEFEGGGVAYSPFGQSRPTAHTTNEK